MAEDRAEIERDEASSKGQVVFEATGAQILTYDRESASLPYTLYHGQRLLSFRVRAGPSPTKRMASTDSFIQLKLAVRIMPKQKGLPTYINEALLYH